MKDGYAVGLLLVGLVVGSCVGVFVPQVHQAYVTDTRTETVSVDVNENAASGFYEFTFEW